MKMNKSDHQIFKILHLMQNNCVVVQRLETLLHNPSQWMLQLEKVIEQMHVIVQAAKKTSTKFHQEGRPFDDLYIVLLETIISEYIGFLDKMTQKRIEMKEYMHTLEKYQIPTEIRFIKKSELHYLAPNACGICLEFHPTLQTLTCNCQHTFCQVCFQDWKNTCLAKDCPLTCPTCRTPITHITNYRQKTIYHRLQEAIRWGRNHPV